MAARYIHLEDGTTLTGEAFGYNGESTGEVVFSTGMTGYPQSLTDPSFAGQVLVFTYPLIGNYAVPKPIMQAGHLVKNFESERIWAKGVVVSSESREQFHFEAVQSFSDWLASQTIPGISGIDTRALTQKLRERGVMLGVISDSPKPPRSFPGVETDVVAQTSLRIVKKYTPQEPNGKHLALIDCGVKHGIIRELLARGYTVTRVPWDGDPLAIASIDGVVCSNGPGDPKDCGKTIATIKRVVAKGVPFLGVCLGHQLLALAIGADTYKLKYGHRGLNQPCLDVIQKKAYVTSQNHGYAVNRDTIPSGFTEWFINLNDNTNEGLKHEKKPIYSTQFHPEGYPGPMDTNWIFSLL